MLDPAPPNATCAHTPFLDTHTHTAQCTVHPCHQGHHPPRASRPPWPTTKISRRANKGPRVASYLTGRGGGKGLRQWVCVNQTRQMEGRNKATAKAKRGGRPVGLLWTRQPYGSGPHASRPRGLPALPACQIKIGAPPRAQKGGLDPTAAPVCVGGCLPTGAAQQTHTAGRVVDQRAPHLPQGRCHRSERQTGCSHFTEGARAHTHARTHTNTQGTPPPPLPRARAGVAAGAPPRGDGRTDAAGCDAAASQCILAHKARQWLTC